MKENLIIVGASTYSAIAYEIACDMGCFDKIDFVDDAKTVSANGKSVIGRFDSIKNLQGEYGSVVIAIGNAEVRRKLLDEIKLNTSLEIVSLISPRAYVSPNSKISDGCIIEPMAVVHAGCVIQEGCFVSAGAVINHESECGDCVHVDCNATVAGYSKVPSKTKVASGTVFLSKS